MAPSLRLPALACLLGSAHCQEVCGPGEMCLGEDETSMVQGFRLDEVSRRNDGGTPHNKHSVSSLLETAGNMLKNGATPDVIAFTRATLDEITGIVEPAINSSSITDQDLLYRMYDQIEVILAELEQGNSNSRIDTLADERSSHSTAHKNCRRDEAERCEEKRTCDYQLYAIWKTFTDEETQLRLIEHTIHGHFCADAANGTLASFRAAAILPMPEFVSQKQRVEEAEEEYDSHVEICERLFTILDLKTEDCDAKQVTLEGSACAHAMADRSFHNEFAVAWNEALISYNDAVHEVKLLEIDRIQEWRELAVVQCLLNRTTERNGRPCDESTNEVETEITVCENVRITVDIEWLRLDYPVVPPVPPPSPLPPYPCAAPYLLQEYSRLPTVPTPDFTETNSHCNPRPDCQDCSIMIDPASDVTLCTAMWALRHYELCADPTVTAAPVTLPPPVSQHASCPSGWVQVGESGADIGGCGLQSCDQRYGTTSEAQCAAACDAVEECEGFNYCPRNGDHNHESSTVCTLYNSNTPTGTWSGSAGFVQVFCTRMAVAPGTCGVPPDHANAAGSVDVVPVGGHATYVCHNGHSVSGSGVFQQSVRCNANARFGNIISCLPTICGAPPNVRNAALAPSTMPFEIVHGMSAAYECLEGFQLADGSTPFEVSCENGVFGAAMACSPVNCGAPPAILHAKAAAPRATVSYPSKTEYDCDDGYTMDGTIPSSFEISCLASGSFSQGRCEQVECPTLPTLTNAEWTEESTSRIDSGGVLSFTILQYQCIQGYSYTGGASDMDLATKNVECKPNGLYGAVRGCMPINDCLGHSCGPKGVCVDQHMDYTCDCLEGFDIQQVEDAEGNPELICGNADDCHGVQCGEGGTCEDLDGDYACNCRPGFEQIELGADARTCERVECGSPPNVENAIVTSNRDGGGKTIFEDVTVYECLGGHSLNGQHDGDRSFTLTCQETGEFSTVQACIPIVCGQPEQIEHATVSVDAVSYPNAADYQCAEGYTTTGFAGGSRTFQKYCTDSGRLLTLSLGQAVLVSCLPVTCGTPPSFDLAMAGNTAVRSLGETAEYTCIEGHSTDPTNPSANTFTSQCLADGSWTDAPGYCSPVECELPESTPTFNGLPTVAGQEVDIADFTMPVVYTCKDGYTVDGDASSDREQRGVCNAQGVLEISPCLPVVCEYGNVVAGSYASVVTEERDFSFGETVALQCDAGWEIQDLGSDGSANFEVECLESGLFSAAAPCQNIDDCEGHTCGAHGACVDGIQDYSCDCQDGFEESVINGEKICGNIDDCNGVSCGSGGVCTDLVSSFACECNSGFKNEVTGEPDSVCIPKICDFPVLENSQIPEAFVLPFSRIFFVKCQQGFSSEAGEDFPVTCTEDGNGEMSLVGPRGGNVPGCVPRSCGFAPPLVLAATTPDYAHNFVYNEIAHYVCEGGAPEINILCGGRGWTLAGGPGSYYTCQNSCGQPQRPVNGRRNGDGHIFHPQFAELSCDDGYTHLSSGAFSVDSSALRQQCSPTGVFQAFGAEVSADEHGRIECVPVKCELPTLPANWRWTSEGSFNTRTPATLECEQGYSSNGVPHALTQQSVTCNGDGSQSSLPAPCVPVMHRITGDVTDAVNGNLLSNAQVVVTDGTGQPRSVTTSASGVWAIGGVLRGTVTVSITLATYSNIELQLNLQDDISNGPADVAMNPHLAAHSWRVIVSWGQQGVRQNPRDLDGHVTRHPAADGATNNDPGSMRTHLYWRNTWMGSTSGYQRNLNKPYAMLDRDNWSGNGDPETITYFSMDTCTHDCKFVYRVWDYSSCTTTWVEDSQAQVRLYNSDGLHSTYDIGQQGDLYSNGDQRRWDVFVLDVSGDTPQVEECSGSNCPTDNTYHAYNHAQCSR